MSPAKVRKVIVTQGGTADPTQEYERMIMYNEDGTNYEPPSGGVGDVVPTEHGSPASIHDQFSVLDADNSLSIVVSGKAWANASGDVGKVQLLVSGDNGATGTILDVVATTEKNPGIDYTLKGIVPAGWSVLVGWTQEAAGQNGNSTITGIITQILN